MSRKTVDLNSCCLMLTEPDCGEIYKGLNTNQAAGSGVSILPHFGGFRPWQAR